MFIFSFYLGQPRLVEVDLDGFAAEVGAIVLEGESTLLNKGTFGLLYVVVVRYLGWPLLKPGLRKLWGWLIGKCCNAPLKPSPQKLLLEQVTQINKFFFNPEEHKSLFYLRKPIFSFSFCGCLANW
jgi:hypothetical protein